MKIYTKTGDDGTTSYIKNIRVSKDSPITDVLGNIDELNSVLGLIYNVDDVTVIDSIQEFLITLSGYILFGGTEENINNVKSNTKRLENSIDYYKGKIDIQPKFIIPKGYIHFGRTVCRRTERSLVKLKASYYDRSDINWYIQYLNRLSDWLYVFAMYDKK